MMLGSFAFVVLLLFVAADEGSSESIPCLEIELCSPKERDKSLGILFDSAAPRSEDSNLVTLKDVGKFVFSSLQNFNSVVLGILGLTVPQDTGAEGRQYYGTGADYATGYNTAYPGYSLYATGAESSTTFNGLDAALSALAFLAFGVWLFNLVLPQLQVAGLGVPALGRRVGVLDNHFDARDSSIPSTSLVSSFFGTSRALISGIFQESDEKSTTDEVLMELLGDNFTGGEDNGILYSVVRNLAGMIFRSGKTLWKKFQGIWKTDIEDQKVKHIWKTSKGNQKPQLKSWNSGLAGRMNISRTTPGISNTQPPNTGDLFGKPTAPPIPSVPWKIMPTSPTTSDNRKIFSPSAIESNLWRMRPTIPSASINAWKKASTSKTTTSNPWMTHRWKRGAAMGGRGILEDLLGQVWKPLNFLASLISQHHLDHQFPNSRTEVVEDVSWSPIQDLAYKSNDKTNNWNIDLHGNSLDEKEHRHKVMLL